MTILKIFEKISSFFKSLFISGLVTILPITATIFFFNFTYNLLSRWLIPIKEMIPHQFKQIPAIEFGLIVLAILAIGALLKLLIIGPIINSFEQVISKIPLIRTVYSAAKTLAHFFNVPDLESAKKKVILIQFPRPGFYNIAFQLGSAEGNFQKLIPMPAKEKSSTKYYKVFMPNSPNPASGYFLILPEDEIIPTNLTFEEAIKSVVSCGIITPDIIEKVD